MALFRMLLLCSKENNVSATLGQYLVHPHILQKHLLYKGKLKSVISCLLF